MGRSVILGNGRLTVGLNIYGFVHDFYYPYVGLSNLTTARSVRHKIGVWVDGQFSWADEGGWQIDADFESDALVTKIKMVNTDLQVTLDFADFVDSEHNAFCRQITVNNDADHDRYIRLFMHQVFQISNNGRADTALYMPDGHYIFDYKGRCALLTYGEDMNHVPFDQFAIGNYGIEGKEGTYRDAEDGELAGGTVEHGGVDSVIRFDRKIAAQSCTEINYWIAAADTQVEAIKIHEVLKEEGLSRRLSLTKSHWNEWLDHSATKRADLSPEYAELVKKSLLVIKAHTDVHGGIIASADSSMYNYGRDYYAYVWPRDTAYALWPLIRLGYTDEAKRFFIFCRDVIAPDGYMLHKYQPDRAVGSTWHSRIINGKSELPIQEDETANMVYMIGEYLRYSNDIEFVSSIYKSLVKPAADFMARFIDTQTGLPHASFDLWEQKFMTHTYTAAITYQSLLVACEIAEACDRQQDSIAWKAAAEMILSNESVFFDQERGAYRKGFLLNNDESLTFDNTLDVSSLYGVMVYNYFTNSSTLLDTAQLIEKNLLDISPSGGTARFENDGYFFGEDPKYMGNPWIITTLWMAQYYIRIKQFDKAADILEWAKNHTSRSGIFSEQVNPVSSAPISVAPLVWAHAEYINTVLDISYATKNE